MKVVLASRAKGRFWSIEELFGSIVAEYPEWVEATRRFAPQGRASFAAVLANLRWARSLGDCDVVHVTGDIHYAVLGVRSPAILTIHDLRFLEESKGIRRWLYKLLWLDLPCRRADLVTAISETTRQRLLSFCSVSPSKVRTIPNCVAPEFVPRSKPWPASQARMLVLGTTPNKNLERVVAACAGLNVTFTVLGHLSDEQRRSFGRSGASFEEHYDLSRPEVVDLYRSCDLVCFVSTYEGFGMPILEGQATGRPVLTSDIPPMKDVAGGGALLVNPYDTASIREGLLGLMGNPRLRAELVQRGFENVRHYSAVAIAEKYAALYREVLVQK